MPVHVEKGVNVDWDLDPIPNWRIDGLPTIVCASFGTDLNIKESRVKKNRVGCTSWRCI